MTSKYVCYCYCCKQILVCFPTFTWLSSRCHPKVQNDDANHLTCRIKLCSTILKECFPLHNTFLWNDMSQGFNLLLVYYNVLFKLIQSHCQLSILQSCYRWWPNRSASWEDWRSISINGRIEWQTVRLFNLEMCEKPHHLYCFHAIAYVYTSKMVIWH